MPRRSLAEWLARFTEENKLQVSLRRYIHHIKNYLVKTDVDLDELHVYGSFKRYPSGAPRE